MYTPEYSPELEALVDYAFTKSELKEQYPKEKLEKLINLLEDAQYYFEQYREWLEKTNIHDEPAKQLANFAHEDGQLQENLKGLVMFIIGCFYIYLIIPNSIQFQTRNKSFSIYTELKKLYQDELNMTNVAKMVRNYIEDHITADDLLQRQKSRIHRSRAFSVSKRQRSATFAGTDTLDQTIIDGIDAKELHMMRSQSKDYLGLNELSRLSLADKGRPLHPSHYFEPISKHHYEEYDDEDAKTITWKAPQISSNDKLQQFFSQSTNGATLPLPESYHHKNVDKDTYHSAYLWTEEDKDDGYDEVQDDLLIQLMKIKNTATITPDKLLELIANFPTETLLIDLRFEKRFASSHILAENIINIDPFMFSSYADFETPSADERELKEALNRNLDSRALTLFKRRGHFKHVIYYTDMKTFLNVGFDYQLKLFQVLYSTSSPNPTSLIGGYEQWKKFLHDKAKLNPQIDYSKYVYKPSRSIQLNDQTTSSSTISSKSNSAPLQNNQPPPLPSCPPPSLLSSRALPAIPSVPPPPVPLPSERPRMSIPAHPIATPFEASSGNFHPSTIRKDVSRSHTMSEFTSSPNFKRVPNYQKNETRTKNSYSPEGVLEKDYQYQLKVSPNKIFNFHLPTVEDNPDEFISLSIVGLKNIRNTCYINTILQCLFEARLFRNLFLSAKYKEYFSTDYQQRYQLSTSFYALFRKMYMNGGCSVMPSGFLKSCNLLRPDLNIPSSQQDAQEFLLFVLDQLHGELSNKEAVYRDLPHLLLHNDKYLHVDQKEYDSWFEKNYEMNGLSPIDEIFQGQIENCLECQNCGFSKFNYSTFYVLSLAIPAAEKVSRLHLHATSKKKEKIIRLEDCINLFTSDELLIDENAWDCPKCLAKSNSSANSSTSKELSSGHSSRRKLLRSKFFRTSKHHKSSSAADVNSESEGHNNTQSDDHDGMVSNKQKDKKKQKKKATLKSMNFISLPHVLTIHLSRFYYDLTKKNNTMITYPLILNIVLKNDTVLKYRLYGLVNHFGDLTSGHYTALVNKSLQHSIHHNSQKWYYFDDETVKLDQTHGDFDNGFSSISSKDAYVLFYEKIEN
ncbi:hypothetical protein ACO0RG_000064 [Hanseniaspora osmophila]